MAYWGRRCTLIGAAVQYRRVVAVAAILACLCVVRPSASKPLDPPDRLPKWATAQCVATIENIVQHEVGNMDAEAQEFVAESVARDVPVLGCGNLTRWRWAIRTTPKASMGVKSAVQNVLARYPEALYPRCRFVGNLGDIRVWRGAGYPAVVGYQHTVGALTVIGADCL